MHDFYKEKPKKIFIFDNSKNLKEYHKFFNKKDIGYNVILSMNEEDAISIFKKYKNVIDYIILDKNLLNKSGELLYEFIKKNKKKKSLIILISSSDLTHEDNKMYDLCFHKPCSLNAILIEIQNHLFGPVSAINVKFAVA